MKRQPVTNQSLLWALLIALGGMLLLTPRAQETIKQVTAQPFPLGNPNDPSSTDEKLLHPWVLARWRKSRDEYRQRYPNEPQPFITRTFRNRADQDAAKSQGNSQVGWGGSLHNTKPVLAFDIAFQRVGFSRLELFSRFAAIAKKNGLEWGGDWEGFVDRPHFQVPNFYGNDLLAGRRPRFT